MSYSWLPPLLNTVADVAGLEAALALADARGGSRVSFPAKPPKGHWLIDCVGQSEAELICEHFRGGNSGRAVDVPVGPVSAANVVRRQIDQMLRAKVSPDEIAMKLKVHRTTVFRRKANLEPEGKRPDYLQRKDNQLDLFNRD